MEEASVRSETSSLPHDLSRYCNMFPDNDTKDDDDNKLNQSSPCDPCSMTPSGRGISDALKQSPHCFLSSATTTPTSRSVTPTGKSLTPSVTSALPRPVLSLNQLTGRKPDQHQEVDRQQQHQTQQHKQPQQLRHNDIEIDVSSLDRGLGSDSDSSSTNGRTEGLSSFQEFKIDAEKDELYWEKRRKNNEAARKSREKRRINDIMLAGRINVLEEDNSRLRRELGALKHKFSRPDVRDYGNAMPKDSAISGVVDKLSSKYLNKNKLSRPGSFIGTLGKPPSHLPYSSPPPLLAVADAMSLYSSGCNQGFPYILPDANGLNQRGFLESFPLPYLTGMQHYHDVRPHHVTSFKDQTKHELVEERKGLARERSNGNIDSSSAFHLESPQAALFRRGSSGSCPQYRSPLGGASPDVSHHPYFNCNIIQASHVYHLQHPYDSHPFLQNSSIPDIHSYDEPLQLTIRRDCCLNSKSNSSSADDNSGESASNATLGEKTPASAASPVPPFQLKSRPKIPTQDVAYSGGLFPTVIPPISAGLSPQSYSNPCFIKGVPNLETDLFQINPVALVTTELAAPYALEEDGRRNSLETKYLDPKYLERRRRNNEAARKCRENRKSLTQIREAKSSYLETENGKLRVEVTGLHDEMKQLRELIENKTSREDIKGESTFVQS